MCELFLLFFFVYFLVIYPIYAPYVLISFIDWLIDWLIDVPFITFSACVSGVLYVQLIIVSWFQLVIQYNKLVAYIRYILWLVSDFSFGSSWVLAVMLSSGQFIQGLDHLLWFVACMQSDRLFFSNENEVLVLCCVFILFLSKVLYHTAILSVTCQSVGRSVKFWDNFACGKLNRDLLSYLCGFFSCTTQWMAGPPWAVILYAYTLYSISHGIDRSNN